MKSHYILALFLFLINYVIHSQVISGRVFDSITQKPLELANVTFIKTNIGASTDSNGKFLIGLKVPEDSVQISSIGYKSKVMDVSKYRTDTNFPDIFLVPKSELLDEIIIPTKKIAYTSTIKLGLDKNHKVRSGFPFGYEFSNLIKNPSGKKGRLESVILSLNRRKESDYLATYNIRFYEYDATTNSPGDEIHFSNLIVEPDNKTYKLRIDVSELKIPFPENGICIGVEIVNTKYPAPIKSMAKIAPQINFTHTDKEILTWTRYRSKNWIVGTFRSQVKDEFVNAMINVEVRLEK